jgi:hypothetical protein
MRLARNLPVQSCWRNRPVNYAAHSETRMYPGDARHPGKVLFMDALEICHVTRLHLHAIVAGAGHQMARDNVSTLLHFFLEGSEGVLTLAIEGDVHILQDFVPENQCCDQSPENTMREQGIRRKSASHRW